MDSSKDSPPYYDVTNITSSENDSSKTSILRRDANKKWCTYSTVRKRLPILQWLPTYSFSFLAQDFLAGFTVGLTAIPQGIAYAGVAGVPAQYGLYSGVMACIVYMFLGSCKDINIGPTAIMSLMVQEHVDKFGPDVAVFMCFVSGCIIFLFGIFHLGFLVQFISYPVAAAFTSAAAITIGSSQIKSLLGIGGKANQFLESWEAVINHITEVKWQDTTLGLCSIVTLLFLRYLRAFGHRESVPSKTKFQNFMAKVFWMLGLGSNAIVVLIGTIIAWLFSINGLQSFAITGTVEKGLPPFSWPPFSASYKNETFTFKEMVDDVQIGILTIPIIAILESIAVAKSFAKGRTVDATQEMIALGMSNICGSFFRSMPATGSFTRTAVNNASGVQTTFGGVFTASLVLLALSFLTSAFQYIPKATLAAVIITAMVFMLETRAVMLLWNTKKVDLAIFILTVAACLFITLEIGILIGIGINALWVLYSAARPKIYVELTTVSNRRVLLVTPSQSLLFPSAEYVRETVIDELEYHLNESTVNLNTYQRRDIEEHNNIIVVLDGRNVLYIDSTVAKNLKTLVEDLDIRKNRVIFWRWSRSAEEVCRGLDIKLAGLFVQANTLQLAIGDWESHFSNSTEQI